MYDAAPDCDGDRSVRSLAPSFPMMCSRCTLTVSSEMNSSSPISRFLLPPDKQAKHFDLAFAERFVAEMFRQSRGYRGGARTSSARKRLMPSFPVDAVPTMLMSDWLSMTTVMPSRIRG